MNTASKISALQPACVWSTVLSTNIKKSECTSYAMLLSSPSFELFLPYKAGENFDSNQLKKFEFQICK